MITETASKAELFPAPPMAPPAKSRAASLFLISLLLTSAAFPPLASGCDTCTTPRPKKHNPKQRSPPAVTSPPAVFPPPVDDGDPAAKCSVEYILKLGLCLDALGGLVHVGLGRPAENACCPVLEGLLEAEAAACLCTAIKLRVLNLDIYIPLALQLLVTCGKDPAPGYLCPLN